jgi:hypothetical protein
MQKEKENQINDRLREIYEPRYGRRLSDEEVREIRTNLEAFAEGIMEIAQRLYGRTGNLPENERGTQIIGHEA